MVNDNENKDGAPRRRKGLFGTRRARSDGGAAGQDSASGQGSGGNSSGQGIRSSRDDAATRERVQSGVPHPESAHTDADHISGAAAADLPYDDAAFHDLEPAVTAPAVEDALGSVPAEIVGLEPMEAPRPEEHVSPPRPTTSLLFQAPDIQAYQYRPSTRRAAPVDDTEDDDRSGDDGSSEDRSGDGRGDRSGDDRGDESSTVRRRSRRRSGDEDADGGETPPNTVVKVRTPRPLPELTTEPQRIKGSTRLEAKKQRRRDGRDAGRRRPVITEAEFIARRESVDRQMVVRSKYGRIQIGVLEDGVLAEHYVAKSQEASLIGNVYLGRVQNVLPSMEAAFIDIGRGRNAVLYSGEVDWEAAAEGTTGHQARRIELALKPGDRVLVQVTKDPIGHKGARLTSQVSLPGRYLVYVPNGSMSGISRKLPDTERARLKKVLKEVLPPNVGVIVRTAAEGASDEQLALDVNRLTAQWARISEILETVQAPALLHSEPDLLVKIVRDVFNEDFQKLVIEGDDAEETITAYLRQVAPDLIDRVERYEGDADSFDAFRISEQIEKALDRKVWLPSGGSLVMDRTEAMTVIDVNTGKFVGSGGNLEETVTKNNIEAAEEIVRQLRLRDIGGIIVVDFIDMVLETNRDLVLRRLVECLSRDRTKHQVAEVTSLGLVQMTRKKLGLGLIESFSENCEVCAGRGIIVKHDPDNKHKQTPQPDMPRRGRKGNGNGNGGGGNSSGSNGNGSSASNSSSSSASKSGAGTHAITDDVRNALAKIATSTIATAAAAAQVVTDAPAAAPREASVERTQEQAEAPRTTGASAVISDSGEDVVGVDSVIEAPGRSGRSGGRRARSSGGQERVASGAGTPDRHAAAAPAVDSPVVSSVVGSAADASVDSPSVDLAALPDSAAKVTQSTGTRRARGGRGRRVTASDPIHADAAGSGFIAAPSTPVAVAPASPAEPVAEESIAILDIPVKQQRAMRAVPAEIAEQILDSVLDALPEPPQPGQGRARTSRRASSQGTVTAAVGDSSE